MQQSQQVLKYHERTLNLSPDLNLSSNDQPKVADQIAWVKTRQAILATTRTSSLKVVMADVLRDVGPEIFPSDAPRRAGLRLAWNVCTHIGDLAAWHELALCSLRRGWSLYASP